MKVLLLSHGYFAKEVYETASMIIGKLENVEYIALPYGEDLGEYKKKICSIIESNNQTLILCDLFGGSPFMITSQILSNPTYIDKVELVTGLNMPMILEVVSQINSGCLDIKKIKSIATEAGTNGIADLKEKMNI